MIQVIFFGTHEFAVNILQGLIDSPDIEVALVITQPDKPVGRKKELLPSPIKTLAKKHDIELSQPQSLKTYDLGLKTGFSDQAMLGTSIPQLMKRHPILMSTLLATFMPLNTSDQINAQGQLRWKLTDNDKPYVIEAQQNDKIEEIIIGFLCTLQGVPLFYGSPSYVFVIQMLRVQWQYGTQW